MGAVREKKKGKRSLHTPKWQERVVRPEGEFVTAVPVPFARVPH